MPREGVSLALLLYGITAVAFVSDAEPGSGCPKTYPAVGFGSEFKMVQHQLRGLFTVLDDCSFSVSDFDMISGSDVVWWAAKGSDFVNLTSGFAVSDRSLNQTLRNSSFVVRLRDNVAWSEIGVLAVWDRSTASNFGYVEIENRTIGDGALLSEPTMFENCKVLSEKFRVRWSLSSDRRSVELGLEAATGTMNYMAFGWANPNPNPNSNANLMIGADVAVAGFGDDGAPFVDDFFVTESTDCSVDKDGSAHGVCPDTIFEGSDPVGLVNNTRLVYGHRRDGVSFVRYHRSLNSVDEKYDLGVNLTEEMTVIWAIGKIRFPDTLRPYYLPQNHGAEFGHLALNVSARSNDCFGPLEAEDKEDQDVITADANTMLVVTAGQALRYPNPPNPARVLYINKKEAPVLRVERGVPVKFSIQAGHDVALYITSDPIGGNVTLRNSSEVVYAGGAAYEGVPASPKELVWSPDRNTPNEVYYHSIFEQKMGWRVQVVDGGLADMYDKSVLLDDQQVTFFWTLYEDSLSIAARAEKKSGYLAIGFGSGMANSFAYVGWIDNAGAAKVNTYWIDGTGALSVHATNESLAHVRCKLENGFITLEFTRALKPACGRSNDPVCKNIIDKTTPLKVIWAMGAGWTDGALAERNMHSSMSSRPVRVQLLSGSAEAEQDLRPVLAVHGFMMFLAWGILLPGGILAARYLKHVKGDGWYRIHIYLQYSGLAIVMLALLFAVAELRGFHIGSLHVKFGMLATLLACAQPMNATMRPKKPGSGEMVSPRRQAWEYLHVIVGRGAIVAGVAALFTGMKHLGDRYDGENVHGLTLALIAWFSIGALLVVYLEYRQKRQRREKISGRSNWVLGNQEDDDSLDLLGQQVVKLSDKDSQASRRMEVQLKPLNK